MRKRVRISIILLFVLVFSFGTICLANEQFAMHFWVYDADGSDYTYSMHGYYEQDEGATVRVTNVYSINNTIQNCYYKPTIEEDLPYLENFIIEQGFAVAYTGGFDLTNSGEYMTSTEAASSTRNTGEYIPAEYAENRALQVLGSDILLQNESYDSTTGTYTALTYSTVTKNIAIMNIYKALGMDIKVIDCYFVPDEDIYNSPAILNLPSFVGDVDKSVGQCNVFVTRTNMDSYLNKACNDMKISASTNAISAAEFIVLCYRMMDYYGEPRMSDAEMSAVIQAYGAEVPTYLTSAQQEAYLYLAARGCLNVNITDWTGKISVSDMLDILMCIADEDSRTDYKTIQLTMDINDTLTSQNYYARAVTIADGDYAIQIEKSYDYSVATIRDYYIEVCDAFTFTTTSGTSVNLNNWIMPLVAGDTTSGSFNEESFAYIETVYDSITKAYYYHFQISESAASEQQGRSSSYSNYIQLNSPDTADQPYNIWIEKGGGIYTKSHYSKYGNADIDIVIQRTSFSESQFEGSVDDERVNTDSSSEVASIAKPVYGWLAKAASFITGDELTALAVTLNYPSYVTASSNTYTSRVTYKIANYTTVLDSDCIDGLKEYANEHSDVSLTYNHGTMILEFGSGLARGIDSLLAANTNAAATTVDPTASSTTTGTTASATTTTSTTTATSTTSTVFTATAILQWNNYTSCLVSYDDLVDAGIMYAPENDLHYPVAQSIENTNTEYLVLDSKYGRITITYGTDSTNTGQQYVCVGSTIYDIEDGSVIVEWAGDKLWVSLLAIYGWSADTCTFEALGNGNYYNINVIDTNNSNAIADAMEDASIQVPSYFSNTVQAMTCKVVNTNNPQGSAAGKAYLLTSNYSLSNFVIYQDTDGKCYLIVYYLADAFTSLGLSPPDDQADELQALGVSFLAIDGMVLQVYPLTVSENLDVGSMSYNGDYGWCFNMCEASEFSYTDYLNGKYLLPLCYGTATDGTTIVYNMNVNYFQGYEYGTRPAGQNTTIDVWGDQVNTPSTVSSAVTMEAAPAGIQVFFGGNYYTTFSTTDSAYMQSAASSTSTCIYYGTWGLEIKDSGGEYVGVYSIGGLNHSIHFADDRIFYNVGSWLLSADATTLQTVYTCYGTTSYLGDETVVVEEVEGTPSIYVEVIEEIANEESADSSDFDNFSLEYMLNQIDNATSWIIIFCLEILPYVGIILLTILAGLAFISDIKIVQNFFLKTIDPVRLITFGKMDITQLDKRKVFLGIIIGYCAFAMILDGNFLRVIIWLSEGFSTLAQLLEQL